MTTTTTAITSTPDGQTECPASHIRSAIEYDLSMDPAAVDRVEITNCRNGYARAVAYPPDEETMEALPVFLRKSDEDWHVVESGTGVDCADEGNLSQEMVAACQALGLP